MYCYFFFFKQKTAYEMRISDWSSDVCSSDLFVAQQKAQRLRNGDSVERNNLRRLYHSERGVNAVLVDGSNFFREDKGAKAGMDALRARVADLPRSEEHTSELQSLMRISYAVFCLKKQNINKTAYG